MASRGRREGRGRFGFGLGLKFAVGLNDDEQGGQGDENRQTVRMPEGDGTLISVSQCQSLLA